MNLPDVRPDPGPVQTPRKEKHWADTLADEVHNFTRGALSLFGGAERLTAIGTGLTGPQFPREMNPEAFDMMSDMGYDESLDYYRARAQGFDQNVNIPDEVPLFGGANIPEILGNVAGGGGVMKGTQSMGLFNRGRWRDLAGLGAVEGGLAGLGYSHDDQALRGAGEGAITGGFMSGIAFPLGIRASSFLKGLVRPGQERLSLIMTRAANGADPEELMDDPNMLPADLMPAFGELSNFLARESPEAYKLFGERFGERAAGRMGRVYNYAKDTFRRHAGDNDGLIDTDGLNAIDAARQIHQKEMYRQIFAPPSFPQGVYVNWRRTTPVPEGPSVPPGSAGQTSMVPHDADAAIRHFMNSDAFKDSVPGMLSKYASAYGVAPYREVVKKNRRGRPILGPDGQPEMVREYSLEFVSKVYKDLGEEAAGFFEGIGKDRKPGLGHMRQVAADMGAEAILALSPHWNQVQSYSGQTIRMRNAFNDAKEHINNNVTVADVQRYWKELNDSQRAWETQKQKYGFEVEGKTDNVIDAYRSGWLEAISEMVEKNSGNPETLRQMLQHNFRTKVRLVSPRNAGGQYLTDKIKMEQRFSNTETLARPNRVNLKKEEDNISIARVIIRNLMWYTGFSMSELGERSFRKMLGPGEEQLNEMVANALVNRDLSMIRGGNRYPSELGVLPALATERDDLPDTFKDAMDELESERRGVAEPDRTRTSSPGRRAYEELMEERRRGRW